MDKHESLFTRVLQVFKPRVITIALYNDFSFWAEFFGFRFICVRQKESLSTTECLLSIRSSLSSWSPSGVDAEKQQGAFIRSFVYWWLKLYNVTSQITNIVLSLCNGWMLFNFVSRKSCIKLYQLSCKTDGQTSSSQCIYSLHSWSRVIIQWYLG